MLISSHVPKTAGSTFRALLRRLEPGRVYFDYGTSQYELADPNDPGLVGRLARMRRSWPSWFGPGPWHRIIHGHFPATKYAHRYPGAQLVTWLRDPVERVVSHYRHLQRRPSRAHTIGWRVHTDGLSLLDFAAIDSMRNLQSRYLMGLPLDRFAFIGLQERFDEMLPGFFATVGREPVAAPIRNVSPDKSHLSRYELEPEVRSALLDLNAADVELYRLAQERAYASGWLT